MKKDKRKRKTRSLLPLCGTMDNRGKAQQLNDVETLTTIKFSGDGIEKAYLLLQFKRHWMIFIDVLVWTFCMFLLWYGIPSSLPFCCSFIHSNSEISFFAHICGSYPGHFFVQAAKCKWRALRHTCLLLLSVLVGMPASHQGMQARLFFVVDI